MNRISLVASIVAAAGVAAPALAQDSVSSLGTGLPGDALSAWDSNAQVVRYAVDLSPFTTSWGTEFGVAPLIKLSKSSSGFFASLPNAQFISQDKLVGVDFPGTSYALWEMTPGAGVNSSANTAAGTVSPTGTSTQFGVAVADFGTSDAGSSTNTVIGGLVNYSESEPSRLYVTRVVAANNIPDASSGDVSQFGLGSVDASGNVYYRADDFGLAGAPGFTNISGYNLYRTRIGERTNGTPSIISGIMSTSEATDALLTGAGNNYGPPNNVPASIVGGNGFVATANFDSEFVRGGAAPLTEDGSHFASGISDQRGNLGASTKTPLGGVYTLGMIGIDGTGDARALNVFSVDASGNVVSTRSASTPSSVVDPSDGFVVNYTGADNYNSYRSQVAFRGGTGNVAVGADQEGRLLVASTNYFLGGSSNASFPVNQILVARDNGAGGFDWTVAAYIATSAGVPHKAILDGPGGAVVGRQAPLLSVTGGTPTGPSMSVPAFDSAGNIWFIGAVELFKVDQFGEPFSDFDSALIRAVYNPDSFSYELELVMELGDVFDGLNSGVPYQVQFLEIADSNSMSSGTMFSGNASSTAWNGSDISGASPSDPVTNGGVVLVADITYDVDGDGDFNDPTSGNNTDPSSIDESYGALLYVGHIAQPAAGGCSIADIAEPYGTLNIDDVLAFLGAFAAQDSAADVAAPAGVYNIDDVLAFLGAFAAGCPG